MSQSFDFTSYNNIKRMSEEELTALWESYLNDRTNKSARDILKDTHLKKILVLKLMHLSESEVLF